MVRVRTTRGRKKAVKKISPSQVPKRTSISILKKAAEKKYKDTSVNSISVTTSGTLFDALNLIPRGTSDNSERVGDRITPKALQVRFRTYLTTSAAADRSNMVRCVVFQWFNTSVAPVIADVLEAVGTTNAPQIFYKFDNRLKFRVLYDKTLSLSYEGPSTAMHKSMIIKRMRPMQYSGPNSTDITSNGLYYFFISDSGVVDHPSVDAVFRLTYVDA